MLEVSDKYKEIMKSPIRPKAEPIIRVFGKDANGESIALTWSGSDIQNMKYRRGYDIIGRELPFMELVWTEIYTGNLNEENYPEKYDNLIKYMAVDLTFEQNLEYPTSEIYEELKMPRMFLASKPVIEGATITWTARDMLYFLDGRQTKCFSNDIAYNNVMRWSLLEERGNFLESEKLMQMLTLTQEKVKDASEPSVSQPDKLTGSVLLLDGTAKDMLRCVAASTNRYWDYTGSGDETFARITNYNYIQYDWVVPKYDFTADIMFSYPKLTQNPTVSGYSGKRYSINIDEENQYSAPPSDTLSWKDAVFYHFIFKELGAYRFNGETVIAREAYSNEADPITVTPVTVNSLDIFKNLNKKGEIFTEDNPCNIKGLNTGSLVNARISFIDSFFEEGSYTAEVESLPNAALEPGDFVSIETNLFSGDTRVVKKVVVMSVELEYNGALKQKTTLHTRR